MSTDIESAARRLVLRFRRQRPLRAGSLIVTIFGDAIAVRGGRIMLGSLIRLAAPFGISERLVRTSAARLVQDGWLINRRVGRHSEYRLSEPGRLRFADATRRIYATNPQGWHGRWTLVLLPAAGAARESLRRQLQWLGFGLLAPGIAVHPTLSPKQARAELRHLDAPETIVLEARSGSAGCDSRITDTSWDLSRLGSGYRRFERTFTPAREALGTAASPPPRTAWVLRTLLVHEFRKIHLRDPLLPASLLPADWVGASAYELCRQLYCRVFHAAETELTAEGERTDGRLPELDAEAYLRFGGLPAAPGA